ncbi:hypothetical protein CLI79_00790 [Porphyromonas gingivalis]|nr:hypothetical protein CLI79_00790 [Porphyromonas gingivalis]
MPEFSYAYRNKGTFFFYCKGLFSIFMQAQQQPFDPSFTAPDRRPGRIPTFRRAERERGENRVYARELFHPTPLKTWREIFFVLAREGKNLRAGTKNFWFVFSGKHAPQSAHLRFVNRERKCAKKRKGYFSCIDCSVGF